MFYHLSGTVHFRGGRRPPVLSQLLRTLGSSQRRNLHHVTVAVGFRADIHVRRLAVQDFARCYHFSVESDSHTTGLLLFSLRLIIFVDLPGQ